jgi:hypothetical protein
MADAFKWGSSITIKIDETTALSTAALVDISDYVNTYAVRTAFEVFRIEGMNSDDPERQHGLADAAIPLNGFVNSTTEGIFGPHIVTRSNSTTPPNVSKTVVVGMGVPKNSTSDWWLTGEFKLGDVEFSGEPATIQTWSCNLLQSGALTRTSIEPS